MTEDYTRWDTPQVQSSIHSYRPINSWVLIRKKPRKLMSDGKGGNPIALPEELTNAQHNEHTVGTVLAVGPGIPITKPDNGLFSPLDFQVGDEVVFNPYSAKVVDSKLDLKTVLVPANEVLAVVEEGELQSI